MASYNTKLVHALAFEELVFNRNNFVNQSTKHDFNDKTAGLQIETTANKIKERYGVVTNNPTRKMVDIAFLSYAETFTAFAKSSEISEFMEMSDGPTKAFETVRTNLNDNKTDVLLEYEIGLHAYAIHKYISYLDISCFLGNPMTKKKLGLKYLGKDIQTDQHIFVDKMNNYGCVSNQKVDLDLYQVIDTVVYIRDCADTSLIMLDIGHITTRLTSIEFTNGYKKVAIGTKHEFNGQKHDES